MTARTKISSGLGRYERLPTTPSTSGASCYRSQKGCTIIVSRDSALELWHMSIAHVRRYPTWDEIADARYEFVPEDVTMAMLLPPPDRYVNANEHCFHLWGISDPRGRP